MLKKYNIDTLECYLTGISQLEFVLHPNCVFIKYLIETYKYYTFPKIKNLSFGVAPSFERKEFWIELLKVFPSLESIYPDEKLKKETITFFEERGISICYEKLLEI